MPQFVIHKHIARRAGKHFDLRLENKRGSFSSWAIPKARMPKKGERFYAVEVGDHPLSYGRFKGEIPSGYGAGTVHIFDKGSYDDLGSSTKKIKFRLNGSKAKGHFVLVKLRDKDWLLMPMQEPTTESILSYFLTEGRIR